MNSIFKKRNPDVEVIFEAAGSSSNVMIVAFDYAKKSHRAIILDGNGRELHCLFTVINDRLGIDYLMEMVGSLCKRHKIQAQHVIFGGEDCGAYAFNFIHALASRGFLVIGVNVKAAKKERESEIASTDNIDVIGVAGLMLKMRGRSIGVATENIHGIKRLRRQRKSLLKARIASVHRIYRLVDELFPGFLSEESNLTPFSRASLWLMNDRFSASEFLTRQSPATVRKLKELGIKKPDEAVAGLRALAKRALQPPDSMRSSLQRSLTDEVSVYSLLDNCVKELDRDIAKQFAYTPGALLTAIPGIGLRWAPGLYSELADPLRRRNVHRMAALGGIAPRVKQTGGKGKPAIVGRRVKACNTVLKHLLLSSAISVAEHGSPEVQQAYHTAESLGKDARTKLAQHVLRVTLHIIDHQNFYLPPSLHNSATRQELITYYQKMWPSVLKKWSNMGALSDATAVGAPLRIWRDMIQELYEINLPLTPK